MKEINKKTSNRNLIINILQKYTLIWSPLIRVIVSSLIIETMYLAYPFIWKKLYSIIENKWTTGELTYYFVIWAIYIVCTLICWTIIKIFKDSYRTEFTNKLFSSYRKLLTKFQIHHITDLGTGKLISKFEQWVQSEREIFFSLLDTVIICGIRWLWVLVLYLYYDIRVFGIMIVLLWIYLIIEYILEWRIESIWDKERDINELKSSNLVKYISEFQTIKINNKTDHENIDFDNIIAPLPGLAKKRSILMNIKDCFLEIFFDAGDKAIIFYFGYLALKQWYPISEIIMLSGFIWWLRWPLSQFVQSISSLQYNISKYQNLQDFLATPQTINNGTNSYYYEKGDIELTNISFSYNEDKQILHDFSLHIPGWKTLALVGNSGSGKSTIIKLLLRLYDPQSWSITIDNQNLKDLKIESLYDTIGYLTQEPAVFDGSIRENMMYGAPADVISEYAWFSTSSQWWDDLIRQALDHARCDFVRTMKEGLETQIGERWVKLSWGEKQRLAIARIFFKNPHILILDEPTAALDSISEHHITNTLHELFTNKTVVVIAHRLQTVMEADTIIVLDDGKIVQSGKHSELLLQEGLYKQLVDLQSGIVKEG